jgi:glycosyltransferase involved in cell wall biosynthesis
MHILKTVQAYYPFQEKGGPVVKVRSLSRVLAQCGHRVTVLSADYGLADRKHMKLEIERCRWGWRAEEAGVEAIYLPTLGHYRALTINPRVIDFCRSSLREFDLVHFYGLYDLLGPTVSLFCRKYGIPYVIEPMGMNRPIDRSIRMKRFWHRCLGRRFWQNAARIVATSELEQQELLEDNVPGQKIVMRYNGVDPASDVTDISRGSFRSSRGISTTEPLILFLSRLVPRKGADVLIQAFAQACPESGHLVIAGPEAETGYLAFLEKCASQAGVRDRVLFTGALYDNEKAAAFADADLFVLPSRYENFANVAAEAIAFGVPVIISPFCGIRSLVADRAGLVVSPDRNSLAAAIGRMIDDKPLYEQLKEGCKEVASRLGWDRLTLQMESCYNDVLVSKIAKG